MSAINHVAIIMDGNGRWAQSRSRPRFWGHVRGSFVVSDIVEEADNLGLKALTLFAFSTENWSRPIDEVRVLFKLLRKFILRERQKVMDNNIRFKVIGDISGLPQETKKLIHELEQDSQYHTGLKLSFAFGYGGRKEIIDAVNYFISQNPGKDISEEDLEKRLLTNDVGDVDLLIRTGGNHRISNFLLWQMAYAELSFSNTEWPDFSPKEFNLIINQARNIERRFGTVEAEVSNVKGAQMKAKEHLRLFQNFIQ